MFVYCRNRHFVINFTTLIVIPLLCFTVLSNHLKVTMLILILIAVGLSYIRVISSAAVIHQMQWSEIKPLPMEIQRSIVTGFRYCLLLIQ